uniref:Transmembrane protein n=1 Tax=Heterorhabditis bacteriophora TaxID=37862 RepID=A0A1I7WQN3_HETBA
MRVSAYLFGVFVDGVGTERELAGNLQIDDFHISYQLGFLVSVFLDSVVMWSLMILKPDIVAHPILLQVSYSCFYLCLSYGVELLGYHYYAKGVYFTFLSMYFVIFFVHSFFIFGYVDCIDFLFLIVTCGKQTMYDKTPKILILKQYGNLSSQAIQSLLILRNPKETLLIKNHNGVYGLQILQRLQVENHLGALNIPHKIL